ncbi:MAG TPA: calcium/proton exchanger [Thermomicrobiaceae bacterium]|nr:calcium/proton exchanger [Thermomicrobiaceae bacterium]
MGYLVRGERVTLAIAVVSTVLAGACDLLNANAVLTFLVSGVALATLAAIVGQATEQLGERLGPGATGVLQSALGNLPELFVGIFALRDGLITVVQSALIGSMLANSLLVLGIAITVGGIRHGTQRFPSESPRMIGTLILLAVSALAVPTLARGLHVPAAAHADSLSLASALILLVVFVASIPHSLKGGPEAISVTEDREPSARWPVWLAAALLGLAGVGAAFVSEWFVSALQPAIAILHLSEAFTGLVIVAIAGNAVENVVGVQLAARNKPDYALSVILNSSLQVALALTPALVLLSFVVGPHPMTLVMPGMLVAAIGLTALLGVVITYDGETTWLEGVVLIGLYGIIAASFWWG